MRLNKALGLVVCALLCLGTGSAFGAIEFVNGDFDAGNVGFDSDYDQENAHSGTGQYTTTSTPSLWKAGLTDPTPDGQMLVAQGSGAYNRVWYQDIGLTSGVEYSVAFEAASLSSIDSNYADLGLYVRDGFASTLLSSVTLDSSLGVWKASTVDATFTPGSSGDYEFFIGNNNLATTGNFFAVDNITVVPEPSSLALLGIGSLVGLGVYSRRRRKKA